MLLDWVRDRFELDGFSWADTGSFPRVCELFCVPGKPEVVCTVSSALAEPRDEEDGPAEADD